MHVNQGRYPCCSRVRSWVWAATPCTASPPIAYGPRRIAWLCTRPREARQSVAAAIAVPLVTTPSNDASAAPTRLQTNACQRPSTGTPGQSTVVSLRIPLAQRPASLARCLDLGCCAAEVPSFQNNGSPVPQILKRDGKPPDLRTSQQGGYQIITWCHRSPLCVVWLQGPSTVYCPVLQ